MTLKARPGFLLGTSFAAGAAAALVAGSAFAGICDATCPPGAETEIDACGGIDPDPNGGCNVPGDLFQDLGSIPVGGSVVVCGTVGVIQEGSRDLDWFRVSVPQSGFISASVVHNDSDGNPIPNFVMFIRQGASCVGDITLFAQASGDCPFNSPEFAVPAGDHTVIVSVDSFEEPLCPISYTLTISFEPGQFVDCGDEDAGSCVEPNGTPGCSNFACCETVCAFFSPCCDIGWDEFCVSLAVDPKLCGLFAYECDSPGGAPANDCATDAATLTLDTETAFNNSVAGTDGPDHGACPQSNDLWWKIQSPADGELLFIVDADGWSPVLSVYDLPPGGVLDPLELPSLFIGCVNFAPGGGAVLLLGVEAGDFFLVRVGADGAGGAGTITAELDRMIFNTGGTQPVVFNGNTVNLGLSSGNLGPTLPQRWTATPFTVAAPGAPNAWDVTRIYAYGFSPGDVLNETLNYIVWSRSSLDAPPVDGDQIVSGSIPFPTPTDLPEGAPANESHLIPVDFTLEPGDYWLTVYADNSTKGLVPSNFAWFMNPPNGIVKLDGNGNPYGWRSAFFPDPGFEFFQTAAIQPAGGADPTTIYNVGFRMVGRPTETDPGTPCPGDFNRDGFVDATDLGVILGSWGPCPGCPADLSGDDVVDATDIGILLGLWGPCP